MSIGSQPMGGPLTNTLSSLVTNLQNGVQQSQALQGNQQITSDISTFQSVLQSLQDAQNGTSSLTGDQMLQLRQQLQGAMADLQQQLAGAAQNGDPTAQGLEQQLGQAEHVMHKHKHHHHHMPPPPDDASQAQDPAATV